MSHQNEAEFEAFARARMPELMRAALMLTGDHASAEDLVQSTLTKTYIKWTQVRRTGNPVAYVRTMQTRLFLDGTRRLASRELPAAQVPEPGRGSEEIHELELRQALLSAMRQLPPLDRAIVVQRYLLDVDVATVAADLGLTPAAVRSRASRALARVRTALAPELQCSTNTSHKEQ